MAQLLFCVLLLSVGGSLSFETVENHVNAQVKEGIQFDDSDRTGTGTGVRKSRSTSPYSQERGRAPIRAEQGPPQVVPTITSVHAIAGSNATLECFIVSYPRSVNYWVIQNERLLKNTEKYKIHDEPINARVFEFRNRLRLSIVNVDGVDYSKLFQCFATNKYGENWADIRIEGHSPSIRMQNDTTVESAVGSDFILECIISAVPDGVNYWVRGSKDELINSNAKFSITQHSYNNNLYQSVTRLRILDVQMSDFTTYKCKSKNINGEAEKVFKVTKSGDVLPKKNKTSGANSSLVEYTIFTFSMILTALLRHECRFT